METAALSAGQNPQGRSTPRGGFPRKAEILISLEVAWPWFCGWPELLRWCRCSWQAATWLWGWTWDSLGSRLLEGCWTLESSPLWCRWSFSGKTAGVLVKVPGGSGPLVVPRPPWQRGITGCPRGCSELATGAGRRKRTVLGMEAPCFWMSPWYPPHWQKIAFTGPSSRVAEQVREEDLLRNGRNRALQLLNFLCQFWQFVFFKEFLHFV